MRFWTHVLLWIGVVLAFDVAASVASRTAGIPYAWFGVGSFAIYLGAGFTAAPRFGVPRAVLAAVLVAASEGTLGWGIAILLGAGRAGQAEVTLTAVLVTGLVGGVLVGGAAGLVGALLGARRGWASPGGE